MITTIDAEARRRRDFGSASSAVCVLSSRLYRLDDRRDDLEQVADDAVVGDLEDRRVGILVDRDDRAASPSCRPGAGSRRRCRARDTASARPSGPSCRPAAPSAASRRRRSAATPRARRRAPRRAAARAAMFACSLMPRPTETMRSACDRSTACLRLLKRRLGLLADRRRRRPSTASARTGAGAAPFAAWSARNAPIWNVTKCGAGPCGTTSAVSLPWNIGRTNAGARRRRS